MAGWTEMQRPLTASTRWRSHHGTTYDYVTHVAPSALASDRLYAWTDRAGLRVSDDGGETWRRALGARRFPIATWISTDQGQTLTPIGGRWKPATGSEGISGWFRVTAIDPRDPTLFYGISSVSGVQISRDSGITWEAFSDGPA